MKPTNWVANHLVGLTAAGLLVATPVFANTTQTYSTKNSSAVSKPARASDKTLTNRIDKRLKADASLKRFDIDVSVSGGVATLTGSVRTEAEKDRAARDAHVSG